MTTTPPSQFNRMWSLLQTGPIALIWRFIDQGIRKWTGAPVWRLSRITPQVYVGGQHYQWAALEQEGIAAVVNLREVHYDDVQRGIGGTYHLHLPTRDNTPPSMADLARGADFIAEQIQLGHKVYIHCGVGVGRAPSLAAAYFIKHERLNAREAIRLIRRTRPFVHLTGRQLDQLVRFEQEVQA
jgi:protein-tyrosine phosphatase